MREEFEAWVRRDWPAAPLHYVRDALPKSDPRYGQYCDDRLQHCWVGWQASRAALRVELPEQKSERTFSGSAGEYQYTRNQGFNDCLERVTEALQQAGIEVK